MSGLPQLNEPIGEQVFPFGSPASVEYLGHAPLELGLDCGGLAEPGGPGATAFPGGRGLRAGGEHDLEDVAAVAGVYRTRWRAHSSSCWPSGAP
jgi:hypothetical protein